VAMNACSLNNLWYN